MTSTKAMESFSMFAGQNYTKSETKAEKSDLFSQFLDMSSVSAPNNTNNSKVGIVNMAKNNIKSYDSSATDIEDKVFAKDDTYKDEVENADKVDTKSNDYDDSNKLTKSDEKVEKSVDDNDSDENVESLEKDILKVSKELKEKICEALNITEEELNELLADSQLTILSLFNQDSLMQFAMVVSGAQDMSQILTDENALNVLQAITQAVNEVDVEQLTGIPKDEFCQLVTDVLDGNYINTNIETSNNVGEMTDKIVKDAVSKTDASSVVDESLTEEIVETQEDETVVEEDTTDSQMEEAVQTKKTLTIDVEKDDTSHYEGNSSKNNENSNTALDAFTQNLTAALNQTVTTNEVNFAGQIAQVREVKQIISQIVTQIKVTVTNDTQSIQMQLNPENLGRVHMTLTAKNGVMTAQFIVENETVKEAVESQMKLLIEHLNDQGLKVENLEVTTREFGFEQQDSSQSQSQQNSKAKKAFKGDFFTEEVMQTEETEVILRENNTVSYLA